MNDAQQPASTAQKSVSPSLQGQAAFERVEPRSGGLAPLQTTRFACESLKTCWDEAFDLVRANHDETGFDDEFNPDRKRFLELESSKALKTFTLRTLGGLLVGYSLFVVFAHLHYPSRLWATSDVTYVTPEHRGRRAISFILLSDHSLIVDGVKRICRQVSERCDYSRTLLRLGYEKTETAYVKRAG